MQVFEPNVSWATPDFNHTGSVIIGIPAAVRFAVEFIQKVSEPKDLKRLNNKTFCLLHAFFTYYTLLNK